MARNRQRAKERQAERRAARQAGGDSRQPPADDATRAPEDESDVVNANLGGAPSPLLGQSGFTLAHTSESEEFIGDLQAGDEPYDGDDFEDDGGDDAAVGPRGV